MMDASQIVPANPGFELLQACTEVDTGQVSLRRTRPTPDQYP
jgi:hypothetical protein